MQRDLIKSIIGGVGGLALMCLLTGAAQSKEADAPAMLVFIHPQDYSSEVSLRHYYYNYWVTQGPQVESAAKEVLGQAFGDVGMCQGNNPGKTLVWLRPSIFYNPLMKQYHGKIRASVYSGSGKPLATYIGEGQADGYLDMRLDRERKIATVYKLAMAKVAEKMKADAALQQELKTNVAPDNAPSPCAMVTLLPAPAVSVMSF
ncbi:MAG TPA: hypothetical protein VN084_06025 [Methylophilaceae bacterium]|nr:hypothetical protein [Methylophilaceae bacterium]